MEYRNEDEEFRCKFQADDVSHAEEQAKDYSDCPIATIKLDTTLYYIHKHEVGLQYGGPEEGGWWYESGSPCGDWVPLGPFKSEDEAYAKCRELNDQEHDRAKEEEDYDYTSVLSYRSNHYAYSISETTIMRSYPEHRPYYE